MKKIVIIFGVLLSTLSFGQEIHRGHSLSDQYHAEIEMAAKRGAYSSSAYRLAFSIENVSAREAVGNILRAIDLQEQSINALLSGADPIPKELNRPGNDFKTNAGIALVQFSMGLDCRHCKTAEEKRAHVKAVKIFMDLYDIEAAGARSPRSKVKFSGLPFFSLVDEKFGDPLFQSRAIAFYQELQKILEDYQSHPNYQLQSNVYKIALDICHQDKQAAIELAGVLLSRDSNVIKYFSFIPNANPEFISNVSMIPLLVRLIAGLDKVQTGSDKDRFSFDGSYSANDTRNYYFWSGAMVSNALRARGVSEADVVELNLQFARHYKILRWYESQVERLSNWVTGKGYVSHDQSEHVHDTFRVTRLTGKGSVFSGLNSCQELF